MMETKETLVYSCGYCGKYYRDKDMADCCCQDRKCSDCDEAIGKLSYRTICSDCQHKREVKKELEFYEKAEKLTIEEYIARFPNHPVVVGGNFYFDDFELWFENIDENEIVDWAWGATEEIVTLSADGIVQTFEEDCGLEDYSMDKMAVDEIKKFCDDWNEKYSKPVYYENKKIVVLMNKE